MSRSQNRSRGDRRAGPALATLLLMLAPPLAAQQPGDPGEDVSNELRWRVEELPAAGTLHPLTIAVYEQRGFLPVWTDDEAWASLVRAIEGVWDDGLNPEDYHVSALRAAIGRPRAPAHDAQLELLGTDALVRVRHDLRFGKTAPAWPTDAPGRGWSPGVEEAVAELVELVASGKIQEGVDRLRPRHFVYGGLVQMLSDLRRIRDGGGWEPIPVGPSMRPGSADARVPRLRARLLLEGDLLGPMDDAGLLYDSTMEAAVRSFQHRHGLNTDGVAGEATLRALNVRVEDRIAQVRVNLERARWVAHELPDTFVVVNVAGAKAYVVHGDRVVYETRAVVGAKRTPTPLFTAEMRWIDLNPTWTVPPGILEEVLDLVRADSTYLPSQGMRVLDVSGNEVDPRGIDFSRLSVSDFPYLIRQDPGPSNPLGRVKLMLPNPYHVYLHDTPAPSLFAREERLFSHGCVRIEDPLGLAEVVLADPSTWNRETLAAAIATGTTRTIRLARPVGVFVLYWTAAADSNGMPHYYADTYGHDAEVLAALDAEPRSGTSALDFR